ncbi:hypothetical protein GQ53DRAFT_855282 [Thozetella sp. PMI_491]|nr:hypothetical protein GQ53DRAFT_855282 [Thozetella sp. PMI_491]
MADYLSVEHQPNADRCLGNSNLSPPYHGHLPPLAQSFVPASPARDKKYPTNGLDLDVKLKNSPQIGVDPIRAPGNKQQADKASPSITESDTEVTESDGNWDSDEDDFGPNRSDNHKIITEHWTCDVDVGTGDLMAPVNVPDTMVDTSDLVINTAEEMAANFRRQNYSATLVAAKIRGGLKQMTDSFLDENVGNLAAKPNSMEEKPHSHHVGVIITDSQPRKTKRRKDPFALGVSCYLRPADEHDLYGIAQIYNWEVKHGSQALDTEIVSPNEFRTILRNAHNYDMPFVVAAEGLPSNLTQPDTQPTRSALFTREELLGFAYLAPWSPGLAGSLEGSARTAVSLHMFVRDAQRRNNVGSCLMDKILSTISTRYKPKFRYHFSDLDKKPEYCTLAPGLKRHKTFSKVYINYFLKCKEQEGGGGSPRHIDESEGDEDLVWLEPLLRDKFSFALMPQRFSHVVRTIERPRRRPAWYDMVVFEHNCHETPCSSP